MAKFFRHTAFVCGLLLAGCGSAAPAAAPASSQAAPASAAKPAGSGAVASAAKPAASSAAAATVSGAPSALANWQAVLDQTTAGAKQEGAITIASQPGQPIRDWINEFSKKYPFVKIEYTGISGNDFVTRVLPEQKAGQYLWDISLGGPSTYYGQLIPANAMDPVLPQLFLPEVLDDSKWTGGFKGAFADTTEQYILSMQSEVEHTVAVNRDSVPASQLTQVEDVIDPKWKGKVSLFDPRYPGAGAVTGAHFIQLKGADWWRQLVETQPAITQDRRQQTEWLVRGQYPITIAPDGVSMKEFKNQGLANSVEFLAPDSDMSRWLLQSLSITLVKRAPHPNAAKLFLNWALTHDAQNLLQKIGNVGSRRSDVSAVEGIERPDPKVTYTPSVNKQANEHFETDAENVAKAALK